MAFWAGFGGSPQAYIHAGIHKHTFPLAFQAYVWLDDSRKRLCVTLLECQKLSRHPKTTIASSRQSVLVCQLINIFSVSALYCGVCSAEWIWNVQTMFACQHNCNLNYLKSCWNYLYWLFRWSNKKLIIIMQQIVLCTYVYFYIQLSSSSRLPHPCSVVTVLQNPVRAVKLCCSGTTTGKMKSSLCCCFEPLFL